MRMRTATVVLGLGGLVVSLAGCAPSPGEPIHRYGDEIVVAGQFFRTGTPVVLWLDAGGYNAYRCRRHFDPEHVMPTRPVSKNDPNRYGTRRNLPEALQAKVDAEGWTLENVQSAVSQFVIHYDVCGTSRQCFKVLQDARGLSVHFMLDVDGTVYQTLDLKERAWHAGTANDQSIGVEIAQIGAYPNMERLNEWYDHDASGWPYVTLPSWMTETGVRTPGFVARPARKDVVTGAIHGRDLMQYDFTDEQYEALTRLSAALNRVLPRVQLDVPRDEEGRLRRDVLSEDELASYCGLLGHWHITTGKIDPGPAFDWERVLSGARRLRGMGLR